MQQPSFLVVKSSPSSSISAIIFAFSSITLSKKFLAFFLSDEELMANILEMENVVSFLVYIKGLYSVKYKN
ncbi:hypothetical protein HanRHA438_Chr10g0466351 [Helianthus annuus]|nr:hypothetical protein HanRHA438_Chr10g0466351 [Helianthus annuus]